MITNKEADERGKISDKIGISYLFDLCEPDEDKIALYLKACGKPEDEKLENCGLEEEDFPLV